MIEDDNDTYEQPHNPGLQLLKDLQILRLDHMQPLYWIPIENVR